MFGTPLYSLGFFVNIDATDPMRKYYKGSYPGNIIAVAAKLTDVQISVRWALPDAEA